MDDFIRQEFSRDLGIDVTSLSFIQENKYCAIYLAETPIGRRIVKKYKGEDTRLAKEEAKALNYYHKLAVNDPDLLDSGEAFLREERNLLMIGFIEGDELSRVLYSAQNNEAERSRSARLMRILGRIIRSIRENTQILEAVTSPFIFEYFAYCSARLEQMTLLGLLLFRGLGSEARKLADSFRKGGVVPSFIHGDFVFKNILVKDEQVGLIDFANSNPLSHPLNDIYNMRFALDNMLLPYDFKVDLMAGFREGLGDLAFSEIAHHFYYEYHRRRWLMLKLSARSPKDKIEGVRGLLTFGRPFTREVMFK